MRVRVYDIRKRRHIASSDIDKWKTGLATAAEFVKFTDFNSRDETQWAVWSGDPFLLVGEKDDLDSYFAGLDGLDRRLLKDHRYFWCLTHDSEYRNPAFQDDKRPIAVNWTFSEQNVISEPLHLLQAFPRLKGLGRSMDLIRQEILRIAQGPTSPGYSVLILGGSGVGKEEVAQSLFTHSDRGRRNAPIHSVSGAWLNMEPGMALTEVIGLEPGRASKSEEYPGLIELMSDGALFFDDFESGPRNVQEALLRIMATPRGKPAVYRRVGGRRDRSTNVWLIFATNADVDKLLRDDRLREDVLYRFEDRVLVMRPLKHRPADLPAISQVIWDQLWEFEPTRKVPLGLPVIKRIASKDLDWEGNVRALRALLGLVVSMRCRPAHNDSPPGDLIEEILARGPSIKEWFRLISTDYFWTGESPIDRIKAADAGFNCLGPSRADQPLVPSEVRAKSVLRNPEGWELFRKLLSNAPNTKSPMVVRVAVRLARIVVYVAENGSVSKEEVAQLTDAKSENTAIGDLAVLANHDLASPRERKSGTDGPGLLSPDGAVYVKAPDFFV